MYNNKLGNYVRDRYFGNIYKNINHLVRNDMVQYSNFNGIVGGNRTIIETVPDGTHMDMGYEITNIPKADISVMCNNCALDEVKKEKTTLQSQNKKTMIGGDKKLQELVKEFDDFCKKRDQNKGGNIPVVDENKKVKKMVKLVKSGNGAKILYKPEKKIKGGRKLLLEEQQPPNNMH